jgi:hypothetical protein
VKMLHLQEYGSSDDDNSDNGGSSLEDITSHLKPLGPGKSITILQNKMQVCSAPTVVPTVSLEAYSSN